MLDTSNVPFFIQFVKDAREVMPKDEWEKAVNSAREDIVRTRPELLAIFDEAMLEVYGIQDLAVN